MYKGKHSKKTKVRKSPIVLMVSMILLVTVAITGTLAFLADETPGLTNIFNPTSVPNRVDEDFDGSVKNEVKITNTSTDVDAYIRAVVVVNWVSTEDSSVVLSTAPDEGTDYEISWTMSGWEKGSDGYYYHKSAVAPGASTGELFTGCKLKEGITAPEGYTLSVEILGQSIQAVGTTEFGEHPVMIAWGESSGGSVTSGGNKADLDIAN